MTLEETQEAEANHFALCLLLPRELLIADVRAMGGIDLLDDAALKKLADRYQVTVGLLVWRLRDLDEGEVSEGIVRELGGEDP